jgi:hypothetical protein
MPKNLRVTHSSMMPKILKPEVKKIQSKVAYHRNISDDSMVAILIMVRNPTACLEMDSELVGKMKTNVTPNKNAICVFYF